MNNNSIPDEDFVYKALLQYNYFPRIKKYLDEMPPIFSSESFDVDTANDLLLDYDDKIRGKGYDQIEFRSTRFNNVTRQMHISHPLPYAKFCECIYDNWDNIDYICSNVNSRLRPEMHEDMRIIEMSEYEEEDEEMYEDYVEDEENDEDNEESYDDEEAQYDERIIVMENENFPDDFLSILNISKEARFIAYADISQFFPSIYTHAIPWALVGHDYAKEHSRREDKDLWFNKLDRYQRLLKRNETLGVPIGSATSNIVGEIILSRIDENLRNKYYFCRYIDDYTCYCTRLCLKNTFGGKE